MKHGIYLACAVGVITATVAGVILLSAPEPQGATARVEVAADSERFPNESDNPAAPASGTGASLWTELSLVLTALVSLVATATSFYLYRWRRILLASPHMLVPEELGRWLEALGGTTVQLAAAVDQSRAELGAHAGDTRREVSNMTETFMALQSALDERDAEIQRLKGGYDLAVFRKFISRFLRVDEALRDFEIESTHSEDFRQIRVLLQDALAECGVEEFAPAVGDDYRTATGVADNPKTIAVSDDHKPFEIAEVIEPGFGVELPDAGFDVIRPAKVRIYVDSN